MKIQIKKIHLIIIPNSMMKLFGYTPDGAVVNSYELRNKKGMKLTVINYGATVVSLKMPLKTGK